MNIYEKLCDARLALQGLNLKKSGNRNKMKYYELADFLPSINAICKEQGILPIVSFTEQSAKLTIVNIEKPEEKSKSKVRSVLQIFPVAIRYRISARWRLTKGVICIW